jgi:hypothetical protein
MFLGAASALILPGGIHYRGIGTVRGAWVLAFCGFLIVVGIGLLKLSRWARLTTIVIVILDLALQGIALANGVLQARPMFLAVFLLRIPIYGSLLWYLLTPEVRLAFAQGTTSEEKIS